MSNRDAQQLETAFFKNLFFVFFSFLAGLMGKRACGREHILCERAVALSHDLYKADEANCTHCLRFCLDARLSGRAAKVRRKCHYLRANVAHVAPHIFFSDTSFSPSAHCHRRHSCCLPHRRLHHYGRRRIRRQCAVVNVLALLAVVHAWRARRVEISHAPI
jgi:hypothetical protein